MEQIREGGMVVKHRIAEMGAPFSGVPPLELRLAPIRTWIDCRTLAQLGGTGLSSQNRTTNSVVAVVGFVGESRDYTSVGCN